MHASTMVCRALFSSAQAVLQLQCLQFVCGTLGCYDAVGVCAMGNANPMTPVARCTVPVQAGHAGAAARGERVGAACLHPQRQEGQAGRGGRGALSKLFVKRR